MKEPVRRVKAKIVSLGFVGAMLAAQFAFGEIVPPPTAEATADAHYQGVTPGPDNQLVIGMAGGPAISAEARSLQPGTLGGPAFPPDIFAWDDSDGRARAANDGTLGAYARAGGYSPGTGIGEGTFATATARRITNWQVAGQAGGTTSIDVSIALDGFIYADEYAGIPAGSVAAEVSLSVNLITSEGTTSVLEAIGRVDLAADPTFDGYFSSINDAGGFLWYSAFTSGPYGLSYLVDFDQSYADMFAVNNNETFALETILTTTARNDWGPFEVFATSDFFNSGDVKISVDSAGAALISQNPIPEPSTFALILLGVCSLVGRRQHFTSTD